jgi:hypothetical protein
MAVNDRLGIAHTLSPKSAIVSGIARCYHAAMAKTYVILDGLSDPQLGGALSAAWAKAGFYNTVDVSGQSAALWCEGDKAITESQMQTVLAMARVHGLELRDRVGDEYQPDNDLAAVRRRVGLEYHTRLATAIVFGLPALVLHYTAGFLAGAQALPRGLLYPWFFEMLLVGWMCLAAGYPMLWQGGLSLRYLRATPDLLSFMVMIIAFGVSVVTWLSLMIVDQPLASESYFHVMAYGVFLAVLQRRLIYRAGEKLAGRANLMIPNLSRFLGWWLLICAGVFLISGFNLKLALATALLLPPMIGHGGINRYSPGPSMLLPVFGFAAILLVGPRAFGLELAGMEIEIAAGFELIMIGVMAFGWREIKRAPKR